jgi:hypothetical protein
MSPRRRDRPDWIGAYLAVMTPLAVGSFLLLVWQKVSPFAGVLIISISLTTWSKRGSSRRDPRE